MKKQIRKTVPKTCEACGEVFLARADQAKINGKARFCSVRCTSFAGGKAATKRWYEAKNADLKTRAAYQYRMALKRGEIIRAKKCEDCEKTKNIHGHHDDYKFPLRVRWLCAGCHLGVHMCRF